MAPDPNAFYRIQNLDHATYLELPSADDNEEVAVRALKPTNKQEWKFKPSQINSIYIIQNAQGTYLSVKSDDPVLVGKKLEADASKWTVTVSGGLYKLKTTVTNTTSYIELGNFGLHLATESSSYDDQKWSLVPAQGPFVGSRRIRSFSSGSLLTLSNGTDTDGVYGSPQTVKNKNQNWSVFPTGNVHFYLKTGDKYLARDDEGQIQASTTAFAWEVKLINGFAYTIFDTEKQLSLGLPDFSINSKAALLPSNNIHGRLWFFEPVVGDSTDGSDNPGSQGGDDTPTDNNGDNGPGDTGTPIAVTITDGQYYLKNASAGSYLATSSSTSLKTELKTSDSSERYQVTFSSDTKAMKIHSHAMDRPLVPDSKNVAVVVSKKKVGGNTWALVLEKKGSTNYFICLYSGGSVTRKVIGNTLSTDPAGIAIVDLKTGDNSQLWQLIRIP